MCLVARPGNLPSQPGRYGQLPGEFDFILKKQTGIVVQELRTLLSDSQVRRVDCAQQEARKLIPGITETRQLGRHLIKIESS